MIRRLLVVLALLAVAVFSLWSRREQPDGLPGIASRPAPPQPGYFTTRAHIVQTGPDGLTRYRVTAEHIQQNPEDLTIRLRELELIYRPVRDSAPPDITSARPAREDPLRTWTLTADTGVMPQSVSSIRLAGDVRITGRLSPQDRAPATIETDTLSVDLDSQTAHTDERVTIVWGQRRLSGTGLAADLKTERIKLESAVHGRFVP